MGLIVSIKRKLDTSEISQRIIIDGQQRITTILLLISALVRLKDSEDRAEELKETYLINKQGKDDLRYKMILTEHDKSSLISILDDRLNAKLISGRIKEFFDFFKQQVEKENLEKIMKGIRKLMIVDISLDSDRDDPQLIFESLNSTGLALSQADLIRNYVLMGLSSKHQEKLYNNYWHTMEADLNEDDKFDQFMRDYLTVKMGVIPVIKNVYEVFKSYYKDCGGVAQVDSVIADLQKYSKYCLNIALNKDENLKLKKAFSDLNTLKVHVSYPFLLEVYKDFKEGVIDKDVFLEILQLVQSYVFRRFICSIPTNSLNKTFAKLYGLIDKNDYLNSLRKVFMEMKDYQRFPQDSEFKNNLRTRSMSGLNAKRSYWLESIENHDRKERVNVKEYTIEHIMPQTLSETWKKMLGEDWKSIHEKYLHMAGNLTLTGYNSELSNKSFSEKKIIKVGFNDSPLKLNSKLRDVDMWNKETILQRTEDLSNKTVQIWSYPIKQ